MSNETPMTTLEELHQTRAERDRAMEGLQVMAGDERSGPWACMYAQRTIKAVQAIKEDSERFGNEESGDGR